MRCFAQEVRRGINGESSEDSLRNPVPQRCRPKTQCSIPRSDLPAGFPFPAFSWQEVTLSCRHRRISLRQTYPVRLKQLIQAPISRKSSKSAKSSGGTSRSGDYRLTDEVPAPFTTREELVLVGPAAPAVAHLGPVEGQSSEMTERNSKILNRKQGDPLCMRFA